MPDFTIGTGYYEENLRSRRFFDRVWWPNTCQALPHKGSLDRLPRSSMREACEQIVVVLADSPCPFPVTPAGSWNLASWIDLPVNPQCGRRLKDKVLFAGWSLGFIHGALFAYSCGRDFIYKEQDCLCFGPWVEKLYAEADKTDSDLLVGELYDFPTKGYLEQCLVLLRYDYIIPFLSALFALPKNENVMKPEQKFSAVMAKQPKRCNFYTFGFGGNRPFDADDSVFCIQKPRWNYETKQIIKTPIGSLVPDDELILLSEKGLLPWPPKGTKEVDWS